MSDTESTPKGRTNDRTRWIEANHSKIGAIVIDEIHAVPGSLEFRKVMELISTVMTLKVPITAMTGTLAPHLISGYVKMMGLPVGYTDVRADTGRPEHKYYLFETGLDGFLDATAAFICETSKTLQGSQRAILFVRSKLFGNAIQTVFPGLGFINGDLKDDAKREAIISGWIEGKSGGWIMGTTSLIQGLDYHDVRLVVFAASPFGMVDFVQGAGRAGRDGKPAKVVMLHNGTEAYRPQHKTTDWNCAGEMSRWLKSENCKREGISECMDGKVQTCKTLDQAIPCDTCEPDHDLHGIWEHAKGSKIEDLLQSLPQSRLTSGATDDALGPRSQLPIVPLRPRLAPLSVLMHSAKKLRLEQARLATATECLSLLIAFAPNCGICNAESRGALFTGITHGNKGLCNLSNKGIWLSFYDWNKPQSKGKLVRGLHRVVYCC